MRTSRSKALTAAAIIVCACALAFAFVFTSAQPTSQAIGKVPGQPATSTEVAASSRSADSSADPDSASSSAAANSDHEPAPGDDPIAYEPGTVLATLNDGATSDQLLEALASSPDLTGAIVEELVDESLVKVTLPLGLAVDRAVDLLESTAPIAAVQPNYRYYIQEGAASDSASATTATAALQQAAATTTASLVAGTPLGDALNAQSATPNDPYYSRQWALPSVNAPEAWNLVDTNVVSPVTVAVIDNGFLVNHEDLKSHVVDAYNIAASSNTIGTDNSDHGTHVAGIVSAVTNNTKGVAAIGDNALGLMLLRVSDSTGEITTEDVVKAYNYLTKNASKYNVRVVNMSLGAGSREPVSRSSDPDLYDAIESARNAGIVTVAAACNAEGSFRPPFYAFPSDFTNVVSVINLKESQNTDGVARDSSSNYNTRFQLEVMKAKNISAPGDKIYSTYNPNNNSYGYESGTSMSAPLVAGVLGLMFAVNPKLTAAQAESLLYSSAKDLGTPGWDRETGYGEVDAAAALKAAGAKEIQGATRNISTCTISVANAVYTGSAIKPSVKVVDGSTVLVENRDYEVSGLNNTDAGAATYAVKGKGNYSGIATGTFTISKASIVAANLKSTSAVYNGKSHKPSVSSVLSSSGRVVSSANYSVTYLRGSYTTSNFKVPGKITVKVVGKNNCSGTITKTFTIKPKGTSIAKLTRTSKNVTVQWKKRTKQTTGYQICLATDSNFTKNKKLVKVGKASTTSKTIKLSKSKKRYYIKIRTYKKTTTGKVYSTWSKTKSIATS